jgi:glutamate racemase
MVCEARFFKEDISVSKVKFNWDLLVFDCRFLIAILKLQINFAAKQVKHLAQAIGIFDSGFGGLTVFRSIVQQLPEYDFVYLGDNARSPYGNRSFETVHEYTLQSVDWFFRQACPLVILACNTASAKALRSIQQNDLPKKDADKRVLGVIRPTAELIGHFSTTKSVGILGTKGTIASQSYPIEIEYFFPEIKVSQQACPMWVPLIENGEHQTAGADYFIEKNVCELMAQDENIDTILLACTHYPLIQEQIKKFLPEHVKLISQGDIVARSLVDYLQRHPEMDERLSKNRSLSFFTTDDTSSFDTQGSVFFGQAIQSQFADVTV